MKWIPVTERLPQKDGLYLVTYTHYFPLDDKSEDYVDIRAYSGDGRWAWKNSHIKAWMYLPKPYKRGVEEEK